MSNSTGPTSATTGGSSEYGQTTQGIPMLDGSLWTAFAVVETSMLVVSLYLLASLVYYMIMRRRRFLGLPKASKRKVLDGLLVILITTYTAASAVKYVLAQVVLYSPSTGELCATFAKANRLLVIIGFGILTLFLWFRQHVLYDMPHVKYLAAPWIKWWSRLTLLLIAISFVTGIVIVGVKQWSHDALCVTTDTGVAGSALAGIVANVIVQCSLLALYCFVIVKRWLWTGDLPSETGRARRLVTKCCFIAAVCASTDIAAFIIVTLIKTFVHEMVTILILDIDQFFNLGCLLLCFSSWRKMLAPWPCCKACDLGESSNVDTCSDADPVQANHQFSLSQISSQPSVTLPQKEESFRNHSTEQK